MTPWQQHETTLKDLNSFHVIEFFEKKTKRVKITSNLFMLDHFLFLENSKQIQFLIKILHPHHFLADYRNIVYGFLFLSFSLFWFNK